jgi:hypothetical protein
LGVLVVAESVLQIGGGVEAVFRNSGRGFFKNGAEPRRETGPSRGRVARVAGESQQKDAEREEVSARIARVAVADFGGCEAGGSDSPSGEGFKDSKRGFDER